MRQRLSCLWGQYDLQVLSRVLSAHGHGNLLRRQNDACSTEYSKLKKVTKNTMVAITALI